MTEFRLIISISQCFESREKSGNHGYDIILTSLTKIRQSVRNLRKEKQKLLTKIRDSDILVLEKIHCLLIAVIF